MSTRFEFDYVWRNNIRCYVEIAKQSEHVVFEIAKQSEHVVFEKCPYFKTNLLYSRTTKCINALTAKQSEHVVFEKCSYLNSLTQ